MSHPDLVASYLGDEEIVATVNLSGDDALIITPSRSLLYRAEGLLSDESVTTYPHDVERLDVSEGRRKATIELSYPVQEAKSLSVPPNRLDTVLHYLLAGVFHANGITGSGESVRSVFRFNELTVAITSDRVLTHVGAPVWDSEYDEYRFAELTGLDVEEGNVATQIVLYIDGRSQRIKTPKAEAEAVKQALTEAVFEYYDVDSMEAFAEAVGQDEQEKDTETSAGIAFDAAVDPLGASATESDPEPEEPPEAWPYEEEDGGAEEGPMLSAHQEAELEAALEALQEQLAEQRRALQAQQEALDDLVAILDREE